MNVSHAGHGHYAAHSPKSNEAKKPPSQDAKPDAPKKSSPPPDSGRKVDTQA